MPKNRTMRITGGFLVRRRFLIPESIDQGLVRPTPDRVREAIFSMIFDLLKGAKVLDLFAGSGAHGFEAISRGASSVHFVEQNSKVAKVILENIKMLSLSSVCSLEIADVLQKVFSPGKFLADIIFLDPPYTLKLDKKFFLALLDHLANDGIVVFRCFKKDLPNIDKHFQIFRDRIYGGTRVFILKRPT